MLFPEMVEAAGGASKAAEIEFDFRYEHGRCSIFIFTN